MGIRMWKLAGAAVTMREGAGLFHLGRGHEYVVWPRPISFSVEEDERRFHSSRTDQVCRQGTVDHRKVGWMIRPKALSDGPLITRFTAAG